jgi:hypothetical protein
MTALVPGARGPCFARFTMDNSILAEVGIRIFDIELLSYEESSLEGCDVVLSEGGLLELTTYHHHIPEDLNLQQHLCENLKFGIMFEVQN